MVKVRSVTHDLENQTVVVRFTEKRIKKYAVIPLGTFRKDRVDHGDRASEIIEAAVEWQREQEDEEAA